MLTDRTPTSRAWKPSESHASFCRHPLWMSPISARRPILIGPRRSRLSYLRQVKSWETRLITKWRRLAVSRWKRLMSRRKLSGRWVQDHPWDRHSLIICQLKTQKGKWATLPKVLLSTKILVWEILTMRLCQNWLPSHALEEYRKEKIRRDWFPRLLQGVSWTMVKD